MTTQIHPQRLALNKAETAGAFFVILFNLRLAKKKGKISAAQEGLEKWLSTCEHKGTN